MDVPDLGPNFWNRLVGLLAVKGAATISAVQELALSFPTSYQLGKDAALRLLNLAKLSMTASINWVTGAVPSSIVIPEVSLPELPNLYGGKPGVINASLLIPSGDPLGQHTPLQFSVDELPEIDQVMESAMDWLDQNQGKYTDFDAYLREAIRNRITGNMDIPIPHWITRRPSA